MRPRLLTALLTALALLAFAAPAHAAQTIKKSIWGPVEVNGESQFPIYKQLGAGIFQIAVHWERVAATRPANPTDPNDPAYNWPPEVQYAIDEGRANGVRVAIQLFGAPRWANGDKPPNWAPRKVRDFANWVTAAAKKYPAVRHWMIWGEPSRRTNFMPLPRNRPKGPRIYARMLDWAYVRLKRESRRNYVIGGNTFMTGDVTPRNFIRYMRLPNGRPPRMDLYGHNPLGWRRPNLRQGLVDRGRYGWADFSDLDTLARWVDRWLVRRGRNRHRPKLFLSEYFLPTDHYNHEFNWYVSRRTQASYLRSALRITRRWRRIYTLGWLGLYDDGTPGTPGDPHPTTGDDFVHRGLIDWQGRKKYAFWAFRKG